MNRRSFFETIAKATAGFMILPAATTYGRVWRAQRRNLWMMVDVAWDAPPISGVLQFVKSDISEVAYQIKLCAGWNESEGSEESKASARAFYDTLFLGATIQGLKSH